MAWTDEKKVFLKLSIKDYGKLTVAFWIFCLAQIFVSYYLISCPLKPLMIIFIPLMAGFPLIAILAWFIEGRNGSKL